jgi:hypothetical protein
MKARILVLRSLTEPKLPQWMAWRSMMPNQISTMFIQDALIVARQRVAGIVLIKRRDG